MTVVTPKIRLFGMDVDGTLTDGTITLSEAGREQKSFHARDGAAIGLLRKAGVTPAILSGRASAATRHRARELGVEHVALGAEDKLEALDGFRQDLGLDWSAVAFVGDDLSDIPVMVRCAFSGAPADAAAETRRIATFVAHRPGGQGAVREVVEHLLRQEDLWDGVLAALNVQDAREASGA